MEFHGWWPMYDNVGVVKGADRRLLGETGVKGAGGVSASGMPPAFIEDP
jgi:hypothetical protein